MKILDIKDQQGKELFEILTETDIERWRVKTFWNKEPETLAWIDSFAGESIFFDIGANIGLYSLYAAVKHPDVMVYAFEADPINFSRAVKNAEINELKNIIVLPLALSDYTGTAQIFTNSIRAGDTGSMISNPENKHEVARTTLTTTADDLILRYGIAAPDYIKIDTDGNEWEVLMGLGYTLSRRGARGLLVEVANTKDKGRINGLMEVNGLRVDAKYETMENHSRKRRGGYPENVIYQR